jgi:hypothetical protein
MRTSDDIHPATYIILGNRLEQTCLILCIMHVVRPSRAQLNDGEFVVRSGIDDVTASAHCRSAVASPNKENSSLPMIVTLSAHVQE